MMDTHRIKHIYNKTSSLMRWSLVFVLGICGNLLLSLPILTPADDNTVRSSFVDGTVNYRPGVNDCAPVSVLNSLKFGAVGKNIYAKIPGEDFEQKKVYAIRNWGKQASLESPQSSLFNNGMSNKNTLQFWNAILRENCNVQVTQYHLNRKIFNSERHSIDQFYGLLKESIENGVPPLITLTAFSPILTESGKLKDWQSGKSHMVCVTKVPAELTSNQLGFAFEFNSSDSGEILEGYATFEHLRNYPENFQGKRWEYNYVSVVSRYLHYNMENLEPSLRAFLLVTDITGEFEAPKQEALIKY